LIEGESGTGKEVAAWLIHRQELAQASRPFVQINLGAIPESVFESEMFGHAKGAFTGADQNKIGLAEAANGGDLFLDEIEALPAANQAKLLRFLESGEIRKVGARETVKVSVRVIAATNRDLAEMVANGDFREDLMWRVSGKRLKLPALRKRIQDVKELATYFLSLERPRRNKTLTDDAIEVLEKHKWNGNVRELKRLCEQVCLVSPLPIVRAEDVLLALPTGSNETPKARLEADLSLGLVELTARFEAGIIREAVYRWPDLDIAAEKIGISRSSMYKKMKDYGIERL
jgi:transcriptional regulator with PAS, ATPase and Fis domain